MLVPAGVSVGWCWDTVVMTSIEAVFEEVAGVLRRCQRSAVMFAELSDEESERTHTAISRYVREATTFLALSAANIQTRSDAPCHLRHHNDHWKTTRTDNQYYLIPPTTADPTHTPIRLESKTPLKLGSPFHFRNGM